MDVASNATSDKCGHRWRWKVNYPVANKVAESPSRPKLLQCVLAANGIPAIPQPWRAEVFGNDHPKPRCFHRRLWIAHDPTDDFVTIAYVVIVITAAAALVGADDNEGGLGHVKRRAVTLIWPLAG